MLVIFPVLLFYGAFAFGYFRLRSPQSKMVRVGLALVVISLVIFGIVLLSIRGPGAAFAVIGLLMGIVFPIFFIGLGLSCGAQSKTYALRGRRNLSQLFFWGPTLIWTALFIWALTWAYQSSKAREADRSLYQSLTIEDGLGPHELAIAISPQIELSYKCHFQRHTKNERDACYDHEYAKDFRLKNQSERGPSAPYLRSIKVFPNSSDCKTYTLNKRHCTAPEKMQQWCAQRAELQSSIWCTGSNRFLLTFQEFFEPNEYTLKSEAKNWLSVNIAEIGKDYNGAPVTVSCSTGRDSFIASRKESNAGGKILGRLCRVKFLVAEKVLLEGKFDSLSPEDMHESARHIYEKGNAYWAEMQRRAGE